MGKFTWRKEWICDYESPWSIFEKFKYANSITNKELYDLFGKTISNHNRIYGINNFSSYTTLRAFDNDKLKDAFEVDIRRMNYLNNKKVFGAFLKTELPDKFIKNELNWCPECIKFGYHSIWHQNIFFNRCFIHNIELVYHCPRCKNVLYYLFIETTTFQIFKCQCGYTLINEDLEIYFTHWNKKHITISRENNNWLNLNLDITYKNWILYYGYSAMNLCRKTFRYDFLRNVIQLYYLDNYKHNTLSSISINGGKILTHRVRVLSKKCSIINEDLDNFRIYLYESYKAIMKSIARQVIKKNKKGREAIKLLRRSNLVHTADNKEILSLDTNIIIESKTLSFAYTYLMWRRDLEGHEDYKNVHSKIRINLFDISYFYSIVSRSNIFDYLLRKYYTIVQNNKPEDIKILMQVLNHIIAHMFIRHYKNWVKASEINCNNSKEINMNAVIEYVMPMFLISTYKSDMRKLIHFHCLEDLIKD